jgi:hypothetical protein
MLLFLGGCISKPEPYVLDERHETAAEITQEMARLEEQAKQQVRDQLAAQEQKKEEAQQEAQKQAEAPNPAQSITLTADVQQSSLKLMLYPMYFMDGSNFKDNFVTIVGEEAPSTYVVAMGNLIARTPGIKPTGFSMLDSDISEITRYNAIIAGNACNNGAIARMFGNPSPCESLDLPSGKGLIRLYQAQNGNVAMLVAGKTDALVVSALNVIGTDEFRGAVGSEACVMGTSLVPC